MVLAQNICGLFEGWQPCEESAESFSSLRADAAMISVLISERQGLQRRMTPFAESHCERCEAISEEALVRVDMLCLFKDWQPCEESPKSLCGLWRDVA